MLPVGIRVKYFRGETAVEAKKQQRRYCEY